MAATSIPALVRLGTTSFLPPGDHRFTWASLGRLFGRTPQRMRLIHAARRVVREAGFIGPVYIGGGFVTTKGWPGDIDIVLDCHQRSERTLPRFARAFLAARDRWKDDYGVDAYIAHPTLSDGARELFRTPNPRHGLPAEARKGLAYVEVGRC
jgi:hypothetical protein